MVSHTLGTPQIYRQIAEHTRACRMPRRRWIEPTPPARPPLYTQLHRVNGTMIERLRQKKARSDSGTQVIGVYKSKNQSYRANICLCGEKYILGAYKTLEEAIQARKQEAQLHEPVLRAYQTWSSYVKIHSDWEKDHPLLFKVQRLGKIEFKMEFSGLPEGEDPSEGRQRAVEENGN